MRSPGTPPVRDLFGAPLLLRSGCFGAVAAGGIVLAGCWASERAGKDVQETSRDVRRGGIVVDEQGVGVGRPRDARDGGSAPPPAAGPAQAAAPSAPASAAPPPRDTPSSPCGSGGTPRAVAPRCLYVLVRGASECCFDEQAAACREAGCPPDRCDLLKSEPPQVRCR